MSTNLNNPEDQADRKKGTLSNQPRLILVTPTVLLGSWVRQPIEDMTSLGTDFEMHAYWQGYTEEPTANDVVARKAHTIASGKTQGTHWNRIKCKERLGIFPEAVVGQATINLYSQGGFLAQAVLCGLSGGLCHVRKWVFKDIM